MATINLLPPRYAFVHALRKRRNFWCAACTLVGVLSILTITISMANTPVTTEDQTRLIVLRTVQEETSLRALTLKADLESKKNAVVLLEKVSRQPDWSILLGDIARMSAGKTQLKTINIRMGSGSAAFDAKINGTSQSQEQVGELVDALRNSEWFEKVTLTGTQRVPKSDPPRYRFDISCEVSGFVQQAEALR